MKGILQKIVGIIGIFVVLGTIVMVALTPRHEGFFPDMFTCEKENAVNTQIETTDISIPTLPETASDTLPEATFDTLPTPNGSTVNIAE